MRAETLRLLRVKAALPQQHPAAERLWMMYPVTFHEATLLLAACDGDGPLCLEKARTAESSGDFRWKRGDGGICTHDPSVSLRLLARVYRLAHGVAA